MSNRLAIATPISATRTLHAHPHRLDVRTMGCGLALAALLMSGCDRLQYDGPRNDVIRVAVWVVLAAAIIAAFWLPHRERGKLGVDLEAFASARGLVRESDTQIGGMVDGLRIRHELIFSVRRDTFALRNFVMSAYAASSPTWPGESSILLQPRSELDPFGGGLSLFGAETIVDPWFHERFVVFTRFPVPPQPALGQRLDGPHLTALPHHMRLSHLEMNSRLRTLIGSRSWTVAVYAGRITVRGPTSTIDPNDFASALAICKAVADHLPAWAASIQLAQGQQPPSPVSRSAALR